MNRKLLQLLLCAIVISLTMQLQAGGLDEQVFKPSNMGTEFYFTFLPLFLQTGNNKLMLYITAIQQGSATVEITAKGFKQKVVLTANTVTPLEIGPEVGEAFVHSSITLPEQTYPGAAIHITSTVPCVVIAVTRYANTSESFTALPIESLGNSYVCASMPDVSWMYSGYSLPSEAAIVAAYDNTVIEFTLGGPSGTVTAGGMTPGKTKKFTMEKGDVWLVGNDQGSKEGDLSGSYITASKPIAVISGNQCANVPITEPWCDFIQEQQLPIGHWGSHYLLPKYEERKNGMYDRVFAGQPNTSIVRNGLAWKTMQTVGGQEGRGWAYDRVQTGNEIVSLRSSQPFSVTLYNPGQTDDNVMADPFQMSVIPWEQFLTGFLFSTPGTKGGLNFATNYMGVVFPLTSSDSIPDDLEFATSVNGTLVWQSFKSKFGSGYASTNIYTDTMPNGSRYAYKECRLSTDGVYALRCSKPIMAYCFGGSDSQCYGHPAALLNLDLLHQADVIAPLIIDTAATTGYYGQARDLPSSEAIRSNMSKILLDSGSVNFAVEYDPFQAGTTSTVGWRLNVNDATRDASATLVCSDAAGNVSKKTFVYISADATFPIIQNTSGSSLCVGDSIKLICPNALLFRSIEWSNGDTLAQTWFSTSIAKDTIVRLSAISTTGNIRAAIPLKLHILEKPVVPYINHVLNILSAQSSTYDSTSYYQWYLDGIAVPNATSLSYVATDKGSYTLKVTNASGCSSISAPLVVDRIVSVEQQNSNSDLIRLQPNPAKSSCLVLYNTPPQLVELYDVKGVLMRRFNSTDIPMESLNISLQSFPSGVYTVQLSYGTELRRIKLIKE